MLLQFIKECDGDTLLAIFDYAFGTSSHCREDNVYIEPGKEDEYGNIIKEEFKDDIVS